MYKGIAFLYIVCFSLYIVYSREPDYFDGEFAPATIYWQTDSLNNKPIPKAVFIHGKKTYSIDARYVLRSLPEQKKLTIIYHPSHPEKAAVYSWWGYWITWGELLGSIILLVALFQVAVAVTSNPTAEALLEQLEYKEEKKKKYVD
jgi:hypothetical protein